MAEKPLALWVLGAGEVAGVGHHALDVVSRGVPGWRLTFLLEEGPLAVEIRRAGGEVVDCRGIFSKAESVVLSVRTLRQVVRKVRPDLVHSHLAWADIVVAFGLIGQNRPYVTTEHGIADVRGLYNTSEGRAELKRRIHRWRLHRTTGLIAVSQATMRSMESQWGPLRTPVRAVLSNGVNRVPAERVPPRQGLRIGLLSRLAPEKRVDLAIRAFTLVHERRPEATLVVAGSGSLEDRLRSLTRTLGVADAVTFVGHVRPDRLWPEIDQLVQVSEWENCSYSLLEAVSQGRGVVATDVGGNRELLPAGCLVSAEPDVEEVASAMLRQEHASYALPPGWPTISDMTRGIASVYHDVLASERDRGGGVPTERAAKEVEL